MPIIARKPLRGPTPPVASVFSSAKRARILYGFLLLMSAVFIIRLFYLQVIRHDYYRQAALNYQLKEYLIPAERGTISAHNGSTTTPLVLNETKFTLFADPVYIKEPEKHAVELAKIISGDAAKITEQLKTQNTRYVVIAKKLNRQQHEQITALDIAGVGTREETYRTYPQGNLAAQLLGFVNDDGIGQYGLEEALNDALKGSPGELKAITDARGVPLVSNPDNVVKEPVAGDDLTLTIDLGMQRQLEDLLKTGLERAKSNSGGAIIMDPNSGAIKAMANYPSFDPSDINGVTDLSYLSNAVVNSPLEVGSIMKTLTAATALNEGVVTPSTAFYNDGYVMVGDRKITDVVNSQGTQTVETVLSRSLNTGAVWLLKQIGQGEINERARFTWHDYLTKRYHLGEITGVEQAGEAEGFIPSPEDTGYGINVTYANTAFGQAMTATPLQMAAAFSSIINGGTYYQPRLVDSYRDTNGIEHEKAPAIKQQGVVSANTSQQMITLLQGVAARNNPGAVRSGYIVGSKSGTAEIAKPDGSGYYADKFNGTYIGFVGGDKPEYVIVIRVNEPGIPGHAGAVAAAPLFKDVSNMLIDNFGVTPKTQ